MKGTDEDDVIIKQDVSLVRATPVDEQRVICGDVMKSSGGDIVSEMLVPGTGCFLQTIQTFLQMTHINLGDEDHGNPVTDVYRQSHEDHHVERYYGNLIDEWAKTWREQW